MSAERAMADGQVRRMTVDHVGEPFGRAFVRVSLMQIMRTAAVQMVSRSGTALLVEVSRIQFNRGRVC